MSDALPEILQTAVLGESAEMPEGSIPVRGYDFNNGCDLEALLGAMVTTGFQVLTWTASPLHHAYNLTLTERCLCASPWLGD